MSRPDQASVPDLVLNKLNSKITANVSAKLALQSTSTKQLNLSLYNCIFGPLRTKAGPKARAKVKSQIGEGSGGASATVELPSALLIAARKLSALISWKFVGQKSWSRGERKAGSTNKATNKNVDLIASLMCLRLVLMLPAPCSQLPLLPRRAGSKDSIESDTIVRTDCRRVATAAT